MKTHRLLFPVVAGLLLLFSAALVDARPTGAGESSVFRIDLRDFPPEEHLAGWSAQGEGNALEITLAPVSIRQEGAAPAVSITGARVVDGSRVVTRVVAAETEPRRLRTVLLFDGSGSMRDNDPRRLRVSAAEAFIEAMDATDLAAVYEFPGRDSGFNHTRRLHGYSSDKDSLAASLARLTARSGTPLYESVAEVARELAAATEPGELPVMLLFADGAPSRQSHRLAAFDALRDHGILLVSVGLGPASDKAPSGVSAGAVSVMRQLADANGGFYVGAGSDVWMESIFSQLGEGLHAGRFALSIELDQAVPVGQTIEVEVETNYGTFRVAVEGWGSPFAAAGLPLEQSIHPGPWEPIVFGGALGDASRRFSVTIDLSQLGLQAGETYFIELEMDRASTTRWRLVPESVDSLLGMVHSGKWRVAVPSGADRVVLDRNTRTAWFRPFLGWSDPVHLLPLHEWSAARYHYTVRRERFLLSEAVGGGSFRLNLLEPRHRATFSTRPVVLLHGFASGADFFSDEQSLQFSDTGLIGGRMASTRPTYTLEVPNIADIPANALSFAQALEGVALEHGVGGVDVIAHSMGGVITRYFQQFIAPLPEYGDYLNRFISMGTPFEGTLHGSLASGGSLLVSFLSEVKLIWLAQRFGFTPARGVGSPAARQLDSPPNAFRGFWRNEESEVNGDDDFLAVIGTNPWSIELVPAIVDSVLSVDVLLNDLKSALSEQMSVAQRGLLSQPSDGLATWASAGKRPLDELPNLYVDANHTGYNSHRRNRDLPDMLSAMEGFLNGQNIDRFLLTSDDVEPRSPLALATTVTRRLLDPAGQAMRNVALAVYDTTTDTLTMVSTFSDGEGWMNRPVEFDLGPTQSLVFVGRGVTMLPATIADAGEPRFFAQMSAQETRRVVLPDTLEVAYDPGYSGPRYEAIVINNGAVTTTQPHLTIRLEAENATEMRVGLIGDGDAEWIPFASTVTLDLPEDVRGTHTVSALFRSSDGTTGTALSASILYEPDAAAGGTLRIEDGVGGSQILLNGRPIAGQTPLVIPHLPSGEYLISIFNEQVAFPVPALRVGLEPGEEMVVAFEPPGNVWRDATNYADGWKGLEWFGLFNDVGGDWIYHAEHGWWYVVAESTNSLWIYDAQLEVWAWTFDWAYPWFYFAEPVNAWTLYERGGSPGDRWFFHTGAQEWRHEGALLNSW